jgi:hypothetical protein
MVYVDAGPYRPLPGESLRAEMLPENFVRGGSSPSLNMSVIIPASFCAIAIAKSPIRDQGSHDALIASRNAELTCCIER